MSDLHDAIMYIDNKMIEMHNRFKLILEHLAKIEDRLNTLEESP